MKGPPAALRDPRPHGETAVALQGPRLPATPAGSARGLPRYRGEEPGAASPARPKETAPPPTPIAAGGAARPFPAGRPLPPRPLGGPGSASPQPPGLRPRGLRKARSPPRALPAPPPAPLPSPPGPSSPSPARPLGGSLRAQRRSQRPLVPLRARKEPAAPVLPNRRRAGAAGGAPRPAPGRDPPRGGERRGGRAAGADRCRSAQARPGRAGASGAESRSRAAPASPAGGGAPAAVRGSNAAAGRCRRVRQAGAEVCLRCRRVADGQPCGAISLGFGFSNPSRPSPSCPPASSGPREVPQLPASGTSQFLRKIQ